MSFAGADVVLISGPCQIALPPGVQCIAVETATEMSNAVFQSLQFTDIFIGVAAVCDFKVKKSALQKIKKTGEELTLILEPCIDILQMVKQKNLAKFAIGFAAETENTLENAREKLNKKADIIVANTVGPQLVFGQVKSQVSIITPEQEIHLASASKLLIARQLVEFFKTYLTTE